MYNMVLYMGMVMVNVCANLSLYLSLYSCEMYVVCLYKSSSHLPVCGNVQL